MTKIYIYTLECKSSWCFNAFNQFVCFEEAYRILLLSTIKLFKQKTPRHIYICLISFLLSWFLLSLCDTMTKLSLTLQTDMLVNSYLNI